ncbi:hypothetical protein HKX48_000384, partial [Thoreauomyces humboldtii]
MPSQSGSNAHEASAISTANGQQPLAKNSIVPSYVHKGTTTWENLSDPASITLLKEQYKDHMSERDYAYFDVFSLQDRRKVLLEAKENLQTQNVEKIKAKTFGMEFLGNVSH